MTPKEFSIVLAAARIGLGTGSKPFRHQIGRLARVAEEIGDRAQAQKLRDLLEPPPPNPYPGAKVVLSDA